MSNDFSRTLSLLRKEKKISQRKAAQALGISQALLSHYENAVREPGLRFVVRAAEYYHVSTDFLLGRTLVRDGSEVHLQQLLEDSEQIERDNALRGSAAAMLSKKMLLNSMAMLFDVLGRCGNVALVQTMSNYFCAAVYKAFRFLYQMNPTAAQDTFSVPYEVFSERCDCVSKQCEADLRQMVHDKNALGSTMPDISMQHIKEQFPRSAPSLLAVLQATSEKMGVLQASKKTGKM